MVVVSDVRRRVAKSLPGTQQSAAYLTAAASDARNWDVKRHLKEHLNAAYPMVVASDAKRKSAKSLPEERRSAACLMVVLAGGAFRLEFFNFFFFLLSSAILCAVRCLVGSDEL